VRSTHSDGSEPPSSEEEAAIAPIRGERHGAPKGAQRGAKERLSTAARLDGTRISAYVAKVLIGVNQLGTLLSVVIIDVVLAGDNAIVVGMAAAGLPAERRRSVICLGIAAATVLRFLFALLAVQLLAIIGLTLAGGVLLLWVSWKMYREIRETRVNESAAEAGCCAGQTRIRRTTASQALTRIVLADVSMSLDNVLAVAGVARDHMWVLLFGLILSVALMGVASTYIARLLDRHFWISWVGLGIITFVALRMIWDGSTEILKQTAALTISPF
jgi:YjbE family integral membrane protein